MDKFETACAVNNIDRIIDEQYGEWGHFHKAAADAVWKAATFETAYAIRLEVASMLAVTVMNESTFDLNVKPNTNSKKRPENIQCPASWDFGPSQINFFWNVLDAWEGNTQMRGLFWKEVFGPPPYEPDAPFNGNPVTNMRACIRIMLSKKESLDAGVEGATFRETQVVHYTGGDAERIAHRRADWRKYEPLFKQFFEAYQ